MCPFYTHSHTSSDITGCCRQMSCSLLHLDLCFRQWSCWWYSPIVFSWVHSVLFPFTYHNKIIRLSVKIVNQLLYYQNNVTHWPDEGKGAEDLQPCIYNLKKTKEKL